jgi:hypothetical protein
MLGRTKYSKLNAEDLALEAVAKGMKAFQTFQST